MTVYLVKTSDFFDTATPDPLAILDISGGKATIDIKVRGKLKKQVDGYLSFPIQDLYTKKKPFPDFSKTKFEQVLDVANGGLRTGKTKRVRVFPLITLKSDPESWVENILAKGATIGPFTLMRISSD